MTALVAEDRGAVSGLRASLLPILEGTLRASLPEPRPDLLGGKLLRPLVGWSVVRHREPDGPSARRFALGALGIQLAHEASLLHDDVLDGATLRRGRPTLHASEGMGAAIVQGDLLLVQSYRLALATGLERFPALFCRAVESTVRGEILQGHARGRWLDDDAYEQIIRAKSGELFGAALALGVELEGGDADAAFELGTRIGALYQRVDDVLDVCPSFEGGKTPCQDYAQQKWTFVLGESPIREFGIPTEEFAARIMAPGRPVAESPAMCAAARLETISDGITSDAPSILPNVEPLASLLGSWVRQARQGVERERSARALPPPPGSAPGIPVPGRARDALRNDAAALATPAAWLDYFGRHGKTFRFAARLFPPAIRDDVAGVYAFCRFTDDLVDEDRGRSTAERSDLLDAWGALAEEAWRTGGSGVPLLDQVLGRSARAGVPFAHVRDLIEGVRMDLEPREYADLAELRVYSYRVASTVGLWLTELFGVHERPVLDRAESMGHAMQLTNILRDVGEDLGRGRLYLPQDHLRRWNLSRADLERCAGDPAVPLPEGWRPMLESLIAVADRDYDAAFPGIVHLPSFFRRPVAVAARGYQGIQTELARLGHDSLRHRARTSRGRKVTLALSALAELYRLERRTPHPIPIPAWSSDERSSGLRAG